MMTTANPNPPEQSKPKVGLVAWLGRLWLCLAECIFREAAVNRGWAFGMLIVAGLLAFEVFNFSTTDFALGDILGPGRFLSVRWATVLAFAFCVIDFAGLARLFTPETEPKQERLEVWYLTGAWFLGATANAALTWWAVSIMLLGQQSVNVLVSREAMLTYVPVLIAGLVWLTRICLISTFAIAGPRLFASPAREALPKEAATTALPAQPREARPERSEAEPKGQPAETLLTLRPLGRSRSRSKAPAPAPAGEPVESTASEPVAEGEGGNNKFSLN